MTVIKRIQQEGKARLTTWFNGVNYGTDAKAAKQYAHDEARSVAIAHERAGYDGQISLVSLVKGADGAWK